MLKHTFPYSVQVKFFWALNISFFAVYLGWFAIFLSQSRGIYYDDHNVYAQIKIVGSDFINLWTAAKLVLAGEVDKLFYPKEFQAFQKHIFNASNFENRNFSYPLHVLPLIAGLGFLPYFFALCLWWIVGFCFYAATVCKDVPKKWMVASALALSPAAYSNIVAGQNAFFTAGLLVLGLRCLERNNSHSGIAFGFLTIKPHLGILVPFVLLFRKQYAAILWACLTAGALVALTIVWFGLGAWQQFFSEVLPFQLNVLIFGIYEHYGSKIVSVFMALNMYQVPFLVAYYVNTVTAFAALLCVLWAYKGGCVGYRRIAIVLTAVFLATPYVFTYDMPILSVAIVYFFLALEGRSLKAYQLFFLTVLWVLPALHYWVYVLYYLPVAQIVIPLFLAWQIFSARAENKNSHGQMARPLTGSQMA